MKIKVVFNVLLIFTFAFCKQKEKNTLETKEDNTTISLKFKNYLHISDTLKIKANDFVISKEPIISYKTQNTFVPTIIDNINDKKTFKAIIEEDTIYLRLRYAFDKFETFVISGGDSVIVEFQKQGINLILLNRKTKEYDYKLPSLFKEYAEPPSFYSFLSSKKRIRNKEEEDNYKKIMEDFYDKKINALDSLRMINLLSQKIYEYEKKSIVYSRHNNEVEIRKMINGNNDDIYIDSYMGMLLKYVNNLIVPRVINTSHGYVLNAKEGFNLAVSDTLFQGKTKDFLLWHYLKGIAQDFSIDDFEHSFKIFSETVDNRSLVNNIKNEYLVDYLKYSHTTDEVFLIGSSKQRTSLDEILAENKGKVILIDFWASWCAPCRKVIPASKELIEEYAGKGLIYLFISIDKNIMDWQKALQKESLISYKHSVLAVNYPNAEFFKELGLKTIPRYLIYDINGKLVHQNAPGPEGPEIRKLLDTYLAE